MNSCFLNFFRAEENRLSRLKAFCDAHFLVFREWSEKIAEISNDSLVSPDEIQNRFFYCKTHDIDIHLEHPMFWDLAAYEEMKRFKTKSPDSHK